MEKTWGEGVTDGGNQSIVGVGSGVSVKTTGTGVAFNASNAPQEVSNNVSAKKTQIPKRNGRLLRMVRNDIR